MAFKLTAIVSLPFYYCFNRHLYMVWFVILLAEFGKQAIPDVTVSDSGPMNNNRKISYRQEQLPQSLHCSYVQHGCYTYERQ